MTRPPGVVLFTFGFGAGLATGLSRLTGLPIVCMLALGVAIVLWNSQWRPVAPAVIAGLLGGAHARADARTWCAALLPLGDRTYRVHAVDPGEGTGRIRLRGVTCSGTVVARWPKSSQLPAGINAVVTGRWEPASRPLSRPDGMLLIRSADSAFGEPTAIERLRTSILRSARTLYGPRAPLVDALIAGWRGEIDPALRAAFAGAGLMHLLAISGFHVGWIAASILLLLRLANIRRHPAECAAALCALGYAAFLGWPAAALRASLLLLLAAGCRWRQRQVRFDALLALSTLALLCVDAWAISEPGAWLSIIGLAGVVAALRWSDRAIGTGWLLRSVSGSTGALVATAPITAAVFGQVAPIGIVLNVAAMPLLLCILPAVFVPVLLCGAFPAAAAAIAASGNGLLALLESLARAGAAVPGGGAGESGWSAAWPWIGLLAAAGWITWNASTWREALRRTAWSATGALGVTLWGAPRLPVPADAGNLTLLFVDVGQGDAAVIRTPGGHWIEVDAGPVGDGRDAGKQVIAPLLTRAGVARVDLFVLSHAHRDHVGGGTSLLGRVRVELAIEPGELFADSAYENWLGALATARARWRAVHAGRQWEIDGVTFRVLHPPSPWPRQGEDLNEDSVVLELSFGGFRALLMGDAGFIAESAMAAGLRPVNLLKVGHHGSRTATSESFLATIRPQVAVVSVGRNHYGHPAPETLDRLARANVAVLRTDVDGTVTVSSDGRVFTVKGARTATTFGTGH